MSDVEYEAILDREQPARDSQALFAEPITLLRSLANYGTNLIVRCWRSSDRTLADAIVLGALLKHGIAMIDACEVLIRQGAVYAANLQMRSLLEVSLYIEWILVDDKEKRALCYYVSDLRRVRLWARRLLKGTPEKAAFEIALKGLDIKLSLPEDAQQAEARRQLDDTERLLATDDLRYINQAFDDTRRKRKSDPRWHEPLGKRTLREIADGLDRLADYELFYSEGSEIAHASSLRRQVEFGDDRAMILIPIRHLEGINTVLNMAIIIALRTIRTTLSHYRPDELPNLARKYAEEWQATLLGIKGVRYDDKSAHFLKL